MSNYSKTTDFEAKDSLPTGDSGKIIRGAEFETEFDAISTAIATKADTAGPTFTGTLTFETISDGTIGVTAFVDEDDMSSDSATLVPTQQSVKAYVDSQVTAQDLDFQADSGGALSIDLDSETLTFTGGTGIDTSGSGNAVTFAIDSTVATLTGTQTLTNKTLTSPDVNTPDIDGGTIDGTVIGGTTPAAVSATTVSATGNITVGGTVDGRDVATDGTKLDGIESGATADQTAAEIRTLVESATDSNVFTDADHSKLDGIEAGATGDQTNAEIRAAVEAATDSNVFTDADHSKLDGIEASADVTDTTNVTAAGALMDSELTSEASVKALNQGVATTDSPTFAGVTVNGTVEFDGLSGTGAVSVTDILDQDDMSSNSATALATQQSIKAYVDSQVATADTLAEVLANGNTTGGTDVAFGDNDKAIFGAGSDLQIYHDGSDSVIYDGGTGNLKLLGTNVVINNAGNTANLATFNDGSDVRLFFNGSQKLATTSTGIDVTGVITTDGMTTSADINFGDNDKAVFGAGNDLSVYHDGSNSYIKEEGTGNLEIGTNGGNITLKNLANSETLALFNINSGVNLYYDNAVKLETTSAGIDVTGTVTADGLTVSGDVSISDSVPILRLDSPAVTWSGGEDLGGIDWYTEDTSGNGPAVMARIYSESSGTNTLPIPNMIFQTSVANVDLKDRMRIDGTGDISFYEDTGTTAKLFWDASAEALELDKITALGDQNTKLAFSPANTARIFTGGLERMRIDSSGNVGINATTVAANGLQIGNLSSTDTEQLYLYSNKAIFSISTNGATNAAGTTINYSWANGGQGPLNFTNATSTVMTLDASGNVGINSSNPSTGRLVIPQSNSAQPAIHLPTDESTIQGPSANTQIRMGGNLVLGSAGITSLSTAGSERMRIDSSGQLLLGRGANVASGAEATRIQFYNTNSTYDIASIRSLIGAGQVNRGELTFAVNNGAGQQERMRLDYSGNLLVGKTVSSFNTAGIEARAGGTLWATADGTNAASFNRKTSDGAIVFFTKDGVPIGNIGTNSGNIYLTDGARSLIVDGGVVKAGYSTGGDADNAQDLGSASVRWKDLYLSGGAYLGGTGSANKLDDYEEGTFTPALTNAGTPTYSRQFGIYRKVGNLVYINLKLTASSISLAAQTFGFSGLPFTATNTDDNNQRSVAIVGGDCQNLGSNSHTLTFRTDGSALEGVYLNSNGSSEYYAYNQLNSSSIEIHLSLTYMTA